MDIRTLIQAALDEDRTDRDLTCIATLKADQQGQAQIRAKAAGVLSGITVARQVFEMVCPDIVQSWHQGDGDHIKPGEILCTLQGPMAALLAAERTALNFLQHLSGIATATHAFVDAVHGTGCHIVDTRKTTPGFRHLEKAAVVHGGGLNHRMNLADGMLIKENHIEACGSITDAVHACYQLERDLQVEVECETLAQVEEAIAICPDIILLDNMPPAMVRMAREVTPASILLEASGNITLENALEYAATGVNRIAIGAITHSAPALDLSMRVSSST